MSEEWDSQEWRDSRDRNLLVWMLGDRHAASLIVDVSTMVETWDDLIDMDKDVSADEINRAFTIALVRLNNNPFFNAHKSAIMPILMIGVNAWFDANELEKSMDEAERMLAFYIRNFCYEFASLCAALVGGYDHLRRVSLEMRRFFKHESYLNWEKRL